MCVSVNVCVFTCVCVWVYVCECMCAFEYVNLYDNEIDAKKPISFFPPNDPVIKSQRRN